VKDLKLTGDERYSVFKFKKKRFDGFKNSSYLCKRNREDSKNVPEVRMIEIITTKWFRIPMIVL
jgi:hypothetical protein